MKREWTLADLNALAVHAEALDLLGVLSVGIGRRRIGVHVTREALASLAQLLGRKPGKEIHPTGEFWFCSLECGDLLLYALFLPEHLPMIGYPVEELPPRRDREPALQAS